MNNINNIAFFDGIIILKLFDESILEFNDIFNEWNFGLIDDETFLVNIVKLFNSNIKMNVYNSGLLKPYLNYNNDKYIFKKNKNKWVIIKEINYY